MATLTQAEEQSFPIWQTMGLVCQARFVLDARLARRRPSRRRRLALDSIEKTRTGCCRGYTLGLALPTRLRISGKLRRRAGEVAREGLALIAEQATGWGLVEVLRAHARCQLAIGRRRRPSGDRDLDTRR